MDYKTRGYPLKEDSHEHYQTQMDLYNFLLRKNGYDTADYTYLLFYYPKEVTKTGAVEFDTHLKKIVTSAKNGEKVFLDASKVLESKKEPESSPNCEYCKYRRQTCQKESR